MGPATGVGMPAFSPPAIDTCETMNYSLLPSVIKPPLGVPSDVSCAVPTIVGGGSGFRRKKAATARTTSANAATMPATGRRRSRRGTTGACAGTWTLLPVSTFPDSVSRLRRFKSRDSGIGSCGTLLRPPILSTRRQLSHSRCWRKASIMDATLRIFAGGTDS
jgi:hypothetical protein